MLKFTPLVLGLLTLLPIAPAAANSPVQSVRRPAADLHAQVIMKGGDRPEPRREQAEPRREPERPHHRDEFHREQRAERRHHERQSRRHHRQEERRGEQHREHRHNR